MREITAIFVTAIVFTGIYGILQLFVRRKERMLIIEKGANPPEIKSDMPRFSSLKFGLLFVGVGAGIITGSIIAASTIIEEEVAYGSMVFIFGGIALLIDHLIERKK
jgi:hypothetical protein